MMKFLPFISKRSVPRIFHDFDGVSLGINGSLLFMYCSSWHAPYLFVSFSMSLLIFGQYTDSRASIVFQFLGDFGVVVLGCHRAFSWV